jgi:hypothetical protein
MSRGLGSNQTKIIAIIRRCRRPLTFVQIRGGRDTPMPVRAVRHSLHKLVKDQLLIAMGKGGRADPHRYFLHPYLIGAISYHNKAEGEALEAVLTAATEPAQSGH